jgi:hypothetical protein
MVTTCGGIASAQDQVIQKLRMVPLDARIASARIALRETEEKTDTGLQTAAKPKRARTVGATTRARLRTELRAQKTRRVVAAQN